MEKINEMQVTADIVISGDSRVPSIRRNNSNKSRANVNKSREAVLSSILFISLIFPESTARFPRIRCRGKLRRPFLLFPRYGKMIGGFAQIVQNFLFKLK